MIYRRKMGSASLFSDDDLSNFSSMETSGQRKNLFMNFSFFGIGCNQGVKASQMEVYWVRKSQPLVAANTIII